MASGANRRIRARVGDHRGFLGDAFGLRSVFLWVLVGLMTVNGAFLTLLYRTYAADVARVQQALESRRQAALAG
ncbi:hypothetical protein [Streptomyces sp. WAC01280]|uniref:hypothetical protein n=1 Tax=Streptomyces sp. WAC01280 TaxID=2487424 RepID=UPI000F76904B|nr:hypothetical protein [Streptomyces sp. WAC01280]RSS56738.1 hypothetical protein EF909_11660 [Streptomyces sp. WAC01280]